jgi:hypothetical protein
MWNAHRKVDPHSISTINGNVVCKRIKYNKLPPIGGNMYIYGLVSECDQTGKKYHPEVMGVWALAQGATGRFCPVLWFGPEYAESAGLEVITIAAAERLAEEKGGWLDID